MSGDNDFFNISVKMLFLDDDYYKYASAAEYYQYDSVPVAEDALFLRPFPAIGGAYQIADAEEVESNRLEVSDAFWEYWTNIMETYTDYTIVTPKTD